MTSTSPVASIRWWGASLPCNLYRQSYPGVGVLSVLLFWMLLHTTAFDTLFNCTSCTLRELMSIR